MCGVMIFNRIIVDMSTVPPRVYTEGKIETPSLEDALRRMGALHRKLALKLPIDVGGTYIGVDQLKLHQFLCEDNIDIATTDWDLKHLGGEPV